MRRPLRKDLLQLLAISTGFAIVWGAWAVTDNRPSSVKANDHYNSQDDALQKARKHLSDRGVSPKLGWNLSGVLEVPSTADSNSVWCGLRAGTLIRGDVSDAPSVFINEIAAQLGKGTVNVSNGRVESRTYKIQNNRTLHVYAEATGGKTKFSLCDTSNHTPKNVTQDGSLAVQTSVTGVAAVKSVLRSERKIKDFLYQPGQAVEWLVGVISDGSSQIGYANYVCEIIAEKGAMTAETRVRIVDVVKMSRGSSPRAADLGTINCKDRSIFSP